MYSFYFEQDGEEILLPIPPANLQLKINNNNKTLDLLNVGEVSVLKDVGLTDIGFSILLPGQHYPFAVYINGFRDPTFYLDKFKQYKTSKKPIRLIINRFTLDNQPLFDQNMLVSLESYTINENAGEEGDIYVALGLKEYRDYLTPKVEIQTVGNETVAIVEQARPAKDLPQSYTVKSGDSLWLIAKRELNDGGKHLEIARINNIADPNLIYPGQVLQLP